MTYLKEGKDTHWSNITRGTWCVSHYSSQVLCEVSNITSLYRWANQGSEMASQVTPIFTKSIRRVSSPCFITQRQYNTTQMQSQSNSVCAFAKTISGWRGDRLQVCRRTDTIERHKDSTAKWRPSHPLPHDHLGPSLWYPVLSLSTLNRPYLHNCFLGVSLAQVHALIYQSDTMFSHL
jgi:hypothetical protein